jgi:hypothetical protein
MEGGAIDVTGRGYLVGRTSGNTTVGAAEGKSGGSYGGLGYAVSSSDIPNKVYGDYTNPDEPGSGGGLPSFWTKGGAGGGLIRITAGNVWIYGSILANGDNGVYDGDNAGSGGGIFLDVGSLVVDPATGLISANGGNDYSAGGNGGGGRIAIYHTQDVSGDSLQNIHAHGCTETYNGNEAGGIGSVYLKKDGEAGQLIFNSHESKSNALALLGTPDDTSFVVEHLIVSGSNTRVATEHNMPIVANSVTIENGGMLTHQKATDSLAFFLELQTGDLTVMEGGAIDVTGRGVPGWQDQRQHHGWCS